MKKMNNNILDYISKKFYISSFLIFFTFQVLFLSFKLFNFFTVGSFQSFLVSTFPIIILLFLWGYLLKARLHLKVFSLFLVFLVIILSFFIAYLLFTLIWASFVDSKGSMLTEVRLGGAFNLYILKNTILYSIPSFILGIITGVFIKRK